MKAHDIGKTTRFMRVHHLSQSTLYKVYVEQGLTIDEIAKELSLGYGCVYAQMKEHKIREDMTCIECDSPIMQYVRKRLCNKCYHKQYYRTHHVKPQ